MTDYQFDSSAIEVVVLGLVRWLVLVAVLLRSRACLVRVKDDGTIKPSADAVTAVTVCAVSAGYCVFKVGCGLVDVSDCVAPLVESVVCG